MAKRYIVLADLTYLPETVLTFTAMRREWHSSQANRNCCCIQKEDIGNILCHDELHAKHLYSVPDINV